MAEAPIAAAAPEKHRGTPTTALTLALGFVTGMAILGVALYFGTHGSKASLELSLPGGGSLKVKPVDQQVVSPRSIDSAHYYIDSGLGFAFRRPDANWSAPQSGTGIAAFLRTKNAKVTVPTTGATNPVQRMFQDVRFLRFTRGTALHVQLTPRTKLTLLGQTIPAPPGVAGVSKLDFSNEFQVSVFDKNELHGTPVSLAQFFGLLSSSIALELQKLVAGEGQIVATASYSFRDVKVNGRLGDFHVDRASVITESADHFYLAEIGYSPQTGAPVETWSEMQDLLNSFVALKS
jgi:hypothetical protein